MQKTGSYNAPMQAIWFFLFLGIAAYVFLVREKYAPKGSCLRDCLKPESHGNLQRPCAAGLKYGREPAAGAARTEHQIQHGTGLAKERAGQKSDRLGEVGVVERVESLDAQLKRSPLSGGKLPPQGKIQLGHPKPLNAFRPKLPCGESAAGLKCGGVDSPAARRGRILDPVGLARRQIRPEYVLENSLR